MNSEIPTKTKNVKTVRKYRWLRRLARVMLGLLIFIVALLFFIRSPWGQDIIVQRAVKYVSGETGTVITLDKAFVTLDGKIVVEGLYMEDQKGDTLLYSKRVKAFMPLIPIIKGNGFSLQSAEWDGLTARIKRDNVKDGFNYQFLVDTFVVEDTTTVSEPLQFELGKVKLTNFDVTLKDKVENLDAIFKFDRFDLEMNMLDLDKMIVDIDHVSLENAIIKYDQDAVTALAKSGTDSNPNVDTTLSEAITDDAGDSPLPKIRVGNLKLKNINATYNSALQDIQLNAAVPYLETAISKANVGKNDYVVDFFKLANSAITINMAQEDTVATSSDAQQTAPFTWPDVKVLVNDVQLTDNYIDYRINNAEVTPNLFNANAIVLKDLNLQAPKFEYINKQAELVVDGLTFKEGSGLNVSKLQTVITVNDQAIVIRDLDTQINDNRLEGYTKIAYGSMDAFIKAPEKSKFNIAIPDYSANLKEVFRFMPELRKNEYMATLSKRPVSGSLKAVGTLEKMQVNNLVASWGNETAIVARGNLQNITDPDNLYFDFPSIKARSTRSDVKQFVNESDLGVTLPERLSIAASLKGTTTAINTDATLTTSLGDIDLTASFKNGDVIAYDAFAKARQINIGALLQNPALGKLTLDLKSKGSGNAVENLNATLNATVTSFTYNGYEIKNLPITGKMNNGKGNIDSKYRDDNLDATLAATVNLGKENSQADLTLDIKGVDLTAFGVTKQNVRAGGLITASFSGNTNSYEVKSNIADGIAIYDNQSYLLGNLDLNAFVRPDSTSMDISNKMLDLKLRSNTDPLNLFNAMQRHVDRYLTTNVAVNKAKPVEMSLTGTVRPASILRDVILPDLEAMDTIRLNVDFNELQRKLDADIVAPYVKYAGAELDSLKITSRSDSTNLRFDMGFKRLVLGKLNVKRTELKGSIAQSVLDLDFISSDDSETIMHIASSLSRKRNARGYEDLLFTLKDDKLILNKNPWNISKDNSIAYGDGILTVRDFELSNGAQELSLRGEQNTKARNNLTLDFDGFSIENITSILNSEEKLVSGDINGTLELQDIFNKLGFEADLEVRNLNALEIPLGTLSLEAASRPGDVYAIDTEVAGDLLNATLNGTFKASATDAILDMDLDIENLNLELVSGLAEEFVKDGKGTISGNLKIAGTSVAPIYNGSLQFKNAGITPVMLNVPFTVKDETVQVSNERILLDSFTILDNNDNSLVTSGSIITEDLLNPAFDLNMTAKNFTALNATYEDNELFYGNAAFDATATLKGNLELPVLNADITVNENTDVYYVVPATELDVVQRDGIVQFVNKENPDDILTQTEDEAANITGFDITLGIRVRPDAYVNVIVDPETGDNLRVAGTGDLRFNLYPNGRMALAGRFEVAQGHYEFSLYEIVSRRFELARGGSVSWSGDPFDATLDLSAIYRVETSASALMASQTSGADLSVKNRFRQELPFDVYLNIDGRILAPEISFKLDMPEDDRGAISGQVYGRLQQLNTQEQELNKQVFSLLVLNKFFPTSGSDGSSGGTAAIARDNINQALSDQLNQFGGKLLGGSGVDLNFGLDSYTDYQGTGGPQDRTQLDITASKKLLNDRLIVSVGSALDVQGSAPEGTEETPVIGNVSLEYLLSESGNWRLRGFRKNQFDNIIDGQLIVSGLSVVLTRDFNEFRNLFRKTEEERLAEKQRKLDLKERKEKEKAKELQEKEDEKKSKDSLGNTDNENARKEDDE